MNERPCKNCHKLFVEHFKENEYNSISKMPNAKNWCFQEDISDRDKYYMAYVPCDNLEYLYETFSH